MNLIQLLAGLNQGRMAINDETDAARKRDDETAVYERDHELPGDQPSDKSALSRAVSSIFGLSKSEPAAATPGVDATAKPVVRMPIKAPGGATAGAPEAPLPPLSVTPAGGVFGAAKRAAAGASAAPADTSAVDPAESETMTVKGRQVSTKRALEARAKRLQKERDDENQALATQAYADIHSGDPERVARGEGIQARLGLIDKHDPDLAAKEAGLNARNADDNDTRRRVAATPRPKTTGPADDPAVKILQAKLREAVANQKSTADRPPSLGLGASDQEVADHNAAMVAYNAHKAELDAQVQRIQRELTKRMDPAAYARLQSQIEASIAGKAHAQELFVHEMRALKAKYPQGGDEFERRKAAIRSSYDGILKKLDEAPDSSELDF